MHEYTWAVNEAKVLRAKTVLANEVKAGIRKDFSEEDVKALYVKYGGLLLEDGAKEVAARAKYFPMAQKAADNLQERVAQTPPKKGGTKKED